MSPVRNLGVDEWAWRKGQNYGTILVDLDAHRVVDLLPDRSAESFAAWLKQHSEVVTVARDRSGSYAEGATVGAPQAQQVADRFHLVVNLSAAMERVLEERSQQLILPAVEPEEKPQQMSLSLVSARLWSRQRLLNQPPLNSVGNAGWSAMSK